MNNPHDSLKDIADHFRIDDVLLAEIQTALHQAPEQTLVSEDLEVEDVLSMLYHDIGFMVVWQIKQRLASAQSARA